MLLCYPSSYLKGLTKTPDFKRLLKVLYLEEPDRLPIFELYVNTETMQMLTNSPIAEINLRKAKHRKAYLEMLMRFYRRFGYDYVPVDVPTDFVQKITHETLDTSPCSTGKRTFVDENEGNIETREDFEDYCWPDLDEAFTYDLLEDSCKMLPKDMGLICGIGSGGIMEITTQLMSLRGFSIALYKSGDLVKDVCDKAGELCAHFYAYVSSLDEIDALSMGDDMGYKSGTIAAPEHIRKYMLPWHKRCVEAAHKYGKPFILHSCGNLGKIMGDLINYLEIDAKHSYQDAIEPVTEAKKKYGDRIAILGGVDVDKLSRFSVHDLRRYVINIVNKCAPGGGYAIGSGNSLPNYVRAENYEEMIKLGIKYGKYPTK